MTTPAIPRSVRVDSGQGRVEAANADMEVLWRCRRDDEDSIGDGVEEEGTRGLGDSKRVFRTKVTLLTG